MSDFEHHGSHSGRFNMFYDQYGRPHFAEDCRKEKATKGGKNVFDNSEDLADHLRNKANRPTLHEVRQGSSFKTKEEEMQYRMWMDRQKEKTLLMLQYLHIVGVTDIEFEEC